MLTQADAARTSKPRWELRASFSASATGLAKSSADLANVVLNPWLLDPDEAAAGGGIHSGGSGGLAGEGEGKGEGEGEGEAEADSGEEEEAEAEAALRRRRVGVGVVARRERRRRQRGAGRRGRRVGRGIG